MPRVQTPLALDFANAATDLGELSQRSVASVESLASLTSLLTTESMGSLGSQSSHSTMPFPFPAPPGIPHVDAHIPYQSICFGDIKRGAKERAQKAKAARGRRRQKRPPPTDHEQQQQQKEGKERDDSHAGQVRRVMAYFHTLHVAAQKTGSSARGPLTHGHGHGHTTAAAEPAPLDVANVGRYEISLQDFEAALKRHARALSTADDERLGRALLLSLDWLLQTLGLTLEQWFHAVDTNNHADWRGHGRISLVALERGIEGLCDRLGLPHWRKRDVSFLLRQLDPNGDGDLSLAEVQFAFARLRLPPLQAAVLRDAGPVLARIHRFLQKNKMKASDVFEKIDRDHSGRISREEMSAALHRLLTLAPTAADGLCASPAHTGDAEGVSAASFAQAASSKDAARISRLDGLLAEELAPPATAVDAGAAAAGASGAGAAPSALQRALAVPLIGKGHSALTANGPRASRLVARRASTMPETEDAFSNHRRALNLAQLAQIRRSSVLVGAVPWRAAPVEERRFSKSQPSGESEAELELESGTQTLTLKQRKQKEAGAQGRLPASLQSELASVGKWDAILRRQLRRLP